MQAEKLIGWTPVKVYLNKTYPVVEWLYLGNVTFSEPFFEQTVARCLCNQLSLQSVQTKLEVLAGLHEINSGLEPTGFIFHMSRCGSTLVSKILSTLPQNLVISEAGPINSILSTYLLQVPEEQAIKWLRLTISALGQRRLGAEKNYFIKFTSWNVLMLPLIKKAFPNVRWVFIYRNPIEVIVSVLKNPTGWMHCRNASPVIEKLTGFCSEEIEQISSEEYCAKFLARLCRTVLQMINQDALMLNYKQLPEAAWSLLPNFFHVAFSADETERMGEVSQFYSKDPTSQSRFTNDDAAKQKEASEAVRKMVDRWLVEPYENLESIRLAQNS